MSCRGLVFDFNGTLVFDMHVHDRAWDILIPEFRGRGFSDQELLDHVNGRNNREIFSYVLGRELSEEESAPLGERKEQLYRDLLTRSPEACRLAPGAEEFLDLLQAHGIPMAVATAAPASNIAFYRQHFHLDRWFPGDRIVYSDGTLPGKPDPAIFNRAIERLGVPAASCLVVEDSVLGVQAAQAAGAGRIVGIYADEKTRASLEPLPLHRLIPDYRGLDLSVLDF